MAATCLSSLTSEGESKVSIEPETVAEALSMEDRVRLATWSYYMFGNGNPNQNMRIARMIWIMLQESPSAWQFLNWWRQWQEDTSLEIENASGE